MQATYLFKNVLKDGEGNPQKLTVTNVPVELGKYEDITLAPGEQRLVTMDLRGLLFDSTFGYGEPSSNYFTLVAANDFNIKGRTASIADGGSGTMLITGLFIPGPVVGLVNFLLSIGVFIGFVMSGAEIEHNNGTFAVNGTAQGAPGDVTGTSLYLAADPILGVTADPNNGAISWGFIFVTAQNSDEIALPVSLLVNPQP